MDRQKYAHVYARNKKNQIGVINFDGSGSHKTQARLHIRDIEALKGQGFIVPKNGIIEFIIIGNENFKMILG